MLQKVTTVLFAILLAASGAGASHLTADMVLYGGKVFTANTHQPWAEGVAIRGRHILAVGQDAYVRSFEGPETRSIDLEGRTVVPGFNDAHTHLAVGMPRLSLPPIDIPGPGPSLEVALGQVAGAVTVAQPGEWIMVVIGELTLADPTADRVALDAVAPNNPVMLLSWTNHTAVINTAAMVAGGIAENEPDPFGGVYDRFPGTEMLNGVIHEYSVFRLFTVLRDLVPDQVLRAQYGAITDLLAQVGVTSVQEMPVGLTRARAEAVLDGLDPAVRIRLICVPLEADEACEASHSAPSDRVRSSGIKWLLDGTPVERSAALRLPWADAPGTGRFNFSPTELQGLLWRSVGRPRLNQPLLHAVGDRAIDNALDALEAVAPNYYWRFARPRIEHGDLVQPEHYSRLRAKRAIIVQNPTHLTLDLLTNLGPERAAIAQPLKSLVEAGVHLALGSDSGFPNPFVDLFFAVTHPFRPEEALTMEQAVTAYTRGSAVAEFKEWRKGSIRRFLLADLAVLSQDIFAIAPPDVLSTTSVLTLVGGEITWDAGVLAGTE